MASNTSLSGKRVRATTFMQDMAESKDLLHVQLVRQDTRESISQTIVDQPFENIITAEIERDTIGNRTNEDEQCRTLSRSDYDVEATLRHVCAESNVIVGDRHENGPNNYFCSDLIETTLKYEIIRMFGVPQEFREITNHLLMTLYESLNVDNRDVHCSGDGTMANGTNAEHTDNEIEIRRDNEQSLDANFAFKFDDEFVHLSQSESDKFENDEESILEERICSPEQAYPGLTPLESDIVLNIHVDISCFEEKRLLEDGSEQDDNYSNCSFSSSTTSASTADDLNSFRLSEQIGIIKHDDVSTDVAYDNNRPSKSASNQTTPEPDVNQDDKSDEKLADQTSEQTDNPTAHKISDAHTTDSQVETTTVRQLEDGINKHKVLPPIQPQKTTSKPIKKLKSCTVRQKTSMKIAKTDTSPHRRPCVPHQLKAEALLNDDTLDITIRGPKHVLPASVTRPSKQGRDSVASELPINVNVTFVETKPQRKVQNPPKRRGHLTFTYNENAKLPPPQWISDGSYDWDVINSRAIGTPFNTTVTHENKRMPFSKPSELYRLGGTSSRACAASNMSLHNHTSNL